MIINHNLMANNAIRNMNINSSAASKSMQKLSSGLRINSAADDAAGLSISEKMRGQIRGLDQASANAQDGISMVQTAEGALNETTSILQRMRELANQSANGTNTTADRSSIQDEINQLTSEINRIGNTTEFNTQKILNGGMDSSSSEKITKATGADKTLSARMTNGTIAGVGTSATKTLSADATTGTVTTATAASTGGMTTAAGTIGAGTTITVDGKVFDVGGLVLDGTASTHDSDLLGAVTAADGTKLSDVAIIDSSVANTLSIESNTSGALSKVAVTSDATLNNSTAVTKQGDGAAIIVDGKSFDLSGTSIDVTDAATKATTIAALKAKTAADGTKLSDVADITFDGDKLTFTSKTQGNTSTIQFEGSDTHLGLIAATDSTSVNKVAGINSGSTSAVKELTNDATTATVATATAASTGGMTTAAGTIGAGTTITVDGKVFDVGGLVLDGTASTHDSDLLGAVTAADGTKLSDVATIDSSVANTLSIESNTSGALSKVAVTSDATLNNSTAVTKQGDGAAIIVDGKSFDLSGTSIDVTDAATKATTIAALGNKTAADGTKLSSLVDITFDGNKLQFAAKSKGAISTIQLEGKDAAALGLAAATDSGTVNKQTGIDGTEKNGTKIIVDNTTFDLAGVNIDTTSATTIAISIESLKNVTSGGTKLGDLVDIKNNGGKLEFTAKSTGSTSSISFSSPSVDDKILGLTVDDLKATAAVKGTDTTIEKAGLQAGKALGSTLGSTSTSDISIAANSTFKVAVGTDSDVTVTLNKSASAAVYNTANADANISKSEMTRLVKDLNSALQDAGLSGKVSASLSADNKIQFISETGSNIEVKDGTNTPLVSNLGFTDKATDMGANKNVQQVSGPGAQGSGYTTSFQIGANKGQTMALNINDMRAAALGITGNAGQQGFTATDGVTNGTTDVKQEAALNVMTKEDATKALDVLDKAIASVSAERGKLGAVQNRLEHTINNLGTSSENLTSAESRIRDVDMAKEMSTFSKNNILSQAAQAMLAQANQQPQQVLQLLR